MALDRNIPPYLTERSNIVRHILFTALFALVFINIYAPFGVEYWFELTRLELLLYSSILILTGVLVVVISRVLMYRYCRRKGLGYPGYIGWVAAEIFFMALVYTILEVSILHDSRDFIDAFRKSVEITALVLLLPYVMLWLYFSWLDKKRQIDQMSGSQSHTPRGTGMTSFYDEKGTLRISLKSIDLLYLEASDNYVTIHFLDGQKRSKYMIRNSMKNLEEAFAESDLARCHRSYMVNFARIRLIRKETDGLHLELDAPEKISLPVSKSYVEDILKRFSAA